MDLADFQLHEARCKWPYQLNWAEVIHVGLFERIGFIMTVFIARRLLIMNSKFRSKTKHSALLSCMPGWGCS